MEDNDVYYKIYKTPRLDDKLTIICMQWFDEYDYDQSRFFNDKDGNLLKFYSEEEAITWLNENIKVELIDPEYVRNGKYDDSFYFKEKDDDNE
jgi:hypothetical protein